MEAAYVVMVTGHLGSGFAAGSLAALRHIQPRRAGQDQGSATAAKAGAVRLPGHGCSELTLSLNRRV
jgi:hypothetical protein